MDCLNAVLSRLDRTEADIFNVTQELAVLRECLAKSGALSQEVFKARLHHRRFEALRQHVEPPLVQSRDESLYDALDHASLLLPIVQFSGLPSTYALEKSSKQAVTALRRLMGPIKACFTKLYVCGGCQRSTDLEAGHVTVPPLINVVNTVERMDLNQMLDSTTFPDWEVLQSGPEMQMTSRSDAVAAILQGRLYICGGQDGMGVLNSACRFHPAPGGGDWEVLPSMWQGRWNATGGAVDGCLYVCGGADNSSPLNSSERFDPVNHAWEVMNPMLRQRSGSVSATLGKALLVAGGGDGQQPLSSAERFSPSSASWEVLPAMAHRRIGAVSAVLHDCWYVCGGGDGHHVLDSVEMFHPQRLCWEKLAPMTCPRWGSVVGVLGHHLYVCGGGTGQSVLRTTAYAKPQMGCHLCGGFGLPLRARWKQRNSTTGHRGTLQPCSKGLGAVAQDGTAAIQGSSCHCYWLSTTSGPQ
eukprot:s3443_g4.t1